MAMLLHTHRSLNLKADNAEFDKDSYYWCKCQLAHIEKLFGFIS